MNLFGIRKPRKFRHTYIYIDERKEHLQKIEQRARREMGMTDGERDGRERLGGTFIAATQHLRKRKQKEAGGKRRMSTKALFLLLIVLLFIWFYLAELSQGVILYSFYPTQWQIRLQPER